MFYSIFSFCISLNKPRITEVTAYLLSRCYVAMSLPRQSKLKTAQPVPRGMANLLLFSFLELFVSSTEQVRNIQTRCDADAACYKNGFVHKAHDDHVAAQKTRVHICSCIRTMIRDAMCWHVPISLFLNNSAESCRLRQLSELTYNHYQVSTQYWLKLFKLRRLAGYVTG